MRGIDSLLKHYDEYHKNDDGKDFAFPSSFSRWEPVSRPSQCLVSNGLFTGISIPPSQDQTFAKLGLSILQVGAVGHLGLGTILAGNIAPKQSGDRKPLNLQLEESQAEPLSSQGLLGTASQGTLAPSQSLFSITKRNRAKQLAKVQKGPRDEDVEEGEKEIRLDDLIDRFDLKRQNGDRAGHFGKHWSSRGWLGVRPKPSDQERRVIQLVGRASSDVMSGRRCRRLSVDLSRPQRGDSESEHGECAKNGRHNTGQAPKSILFDILAQKLDEMERAGLLDTTFL